MQQQMNLVYVGHFTWQDVENMPTPERNWFHNRLVETVDEQNKQLEQK